MLSVVFFSFDNFGRPLYSTLFVMCCSLLAFWTFFLAFWCNIHSWCCPVSCWVSKFHIRIYGSKKIDLGISLEIRFPDLIYLVESCPSKCFSCFEVFLCGINPWSQVFVFLIFLSLLSSDDSSVTKFIKDFVWQIIKQKYKTKSE